MLVFLYLWFFFVVHVVHVALDTANQCKHILDFKIFNVQVGRLVNGRKVYFVSRQYSKEMKSVP